MPEMSILSRLVVDWTKKIELSNQNAWTQIEVVVHNL